jgi:hypothetical protein
VKDFWKQPIVVASYRAVAGALIAGAVAYFAATNQGATNKVALGVGAAAALSYLATRAAAEGLIDQANKPAGG